MITRNFRHRADMSTASLTYQHNDDKHVVVMRYPAGISTTPEVFRFADISKARKQWEWCQGWLNGLGFSKA